MRLFDLLRSVLFGTGPPPDLVVRGHERRQAYGKRGRLRRRRHIRPYRRRTAHKQSK